MKFIYYQEDGKYHGYFEDDDGNRVYCDPQTSASKLKAQAKKIYKQYFGKPKMLRKELKIAKEKDLDNIGGKINERP